jgi:hypothetical protein
VLASLNRDFLRIFFDCCEVDCTRLNRRDRASNPNAAHDTESRELKHLIDPRPAGEVPRPQFAFLRQASNESRILRLRGVRVLAC